MNARVLTCSDKEYFADPCAVPSLSASIAKELILCPSKAWLHHPRLGGQPRKPTASMLDGSILDEFLTNGSARLEVIELARPAKGPAIVPTNYKLDDTQRQRDAILAAGKVPCLVRELEEAEERAAAITDKAAAQGSPLDGERQVAIEWTELADDGTPVLCRCRMDFFRTSGLVQDLKLLHDVSPEGCRRAFRAFGYDLQGAAYLSAVRALMPALVGRERFQLVCAEPEPPYPVTIVDLDGGRLDLGRMKWRRAVNTWATCMRTDTWPDYATAPISLEPSQWELENEYILEGEAAA